MKINPRRLDETLLNFLPLSEAAKRNLARRMAEPSRHYHGRAHIELLWQRHKLFAPEAGLSGSSEETPIALAIAFHDAVYVGGASDNEAQSAELWLEVSATEKVCNEADRLWVAETILATADHLRAGEQLDLSIPRDRARQWVLDLDLTPLGEAPAVFDANMVDLAAEIPGATMQERRSSLSAALRYFATACPLYQSPTLGAVFEASAQQNFARHLRQHAVETPPVK